MGRDIVIVGFDFVGSVIFLGSIIGIGCLCTGTLGATREVKADKRDEPDEPRDGGGGGG